MPNEKERFDSLKQRFILETLSFLTTLEELEMDDVRKTPVKAKLAMMQAESAECFTELCQHIQSLPSTGYEEIARESRMAS